MFFLFICRVAWCETREIKKSKIVYPRGLRGYILHGHAILKCRLHGCKTSYHKDRSKYSSLCGHGHFVLGLCFPTTVFHNIKLGQLYITK